MRAIFVITAALLGGLTASEASAQVTLAALAPRLPQGHRLVLRVDGKSLTGDLVRASADSLVLRRYDTGDSEDIPAARVATVTYDDSLTNGARFGGLVGAVPGLVAGLLFQRYCQNESSSSCATVPFTMAGVTGLLGLGAGAAIDGALKTTARIGPARSSAASATVSVRPDRRRPIALVTIAF